jgi:hypothetical protein
MNRPDKLTDLELVLSRSTGQPEAVFDLTASQATAVEDALSYYRRVRFAGQALEADAVQAMRAMDSVSEQAHRRGDATVPAVMRIDSADAGTLSEAVGLYVAERDVESYQPPEERERIATLTELSGPLRQVAIDLRIAEAQLAAQARQPAYA